MTLEDHCLDDHSIAEIGMRLKTTKEINAELDPHLRFDLGIWYSERMVDLYEHHPKVYAVLRTVGFPSY